MVQKSDGGNSGTGRVQIKSYEQWDLAVVVAMD